MPFSRFLAVVAAMACGCGSDGPSATCGEGTTKVDGTCVPIEDGDLECGHGTIAQDGVCVPSGTLECGPGTVAQSGLCVPDGSLLCDQGTTYDVTSGQCVVDPSACAAGTVLLGGVCVPDDGTLSADHEEVAEPNDTDGAGSFAVPAVGASVTLHGCITPVAGEADEDVFVMTTSTPALIEITADGVGGLAAAFAVTDQEIAGLEAYRRYGLDVTSDTSQRQVFLPVAGTYLLRIDDARALLTGEAAGGPGTCYYATVTGRALPAATPLTVPITAATDDGNVKVYTISPGAAGEIFDTATDTASAVSPSLQAAFVVRKNGAFVQTAAESAHITTGAPLRAFATIGGLAVADQLEIIVDHEYAIGVTPLPFALHSVHVPASPLPENGSQVVLTKRNGTTGDRPLDGNYLSLDVAAGEVVRIDLTSSVATTMWIVRPRILKDAVFPDLIAPYTNYPNQTATSLGGSYVRFKNAGRYYLLLRHPSGSSGQTYTVQSTVTRIMPTALTYDTPTLGVALPTGGVGFHTLDLTTQRWIELAVTATNWGANDTRVRLYDLALEGILALSSGSFAVPVVQTATQPAGGTAPMGRIVQGDARDYLVRIEPTGAPGPSPSYNIIARDRPHVALTPGTTPIQRTDSVTAGGVQRYLLLGTSGHLLDAGGTPAASTVDIALTRLDVNDSIQTTVNANGSGASEMFSAWYGAPPWIALAAKNLDASTTTDIEMDLTATAPLPYEDICASGTTLLTGSDDGYSPVQTLPNGFAFSYYGTAQTQLIASANGFLVFGATPPSCSSSAACSVNGTIPSAAQPAGGLVAPYWDDLFGVTLCRKDEATKVTLQWAGIDSYGWDVQLQVVLNTSGRIDFIYGPGHLASGTSATIGYENSDGTQGMQISQDTGGVIVPQSSASFTTP